MRLDNDSTPRKLGAPYPCLHSQALVLLVS